MASIYQRSGRWYIKMKRGGKWVYRSLGTTSKTEALRLKRRGEQLEDTPPVTPDYARLSLRQMLELALADDDLAEQTRAGFRHAVHAAGDHVTSTPVSHLTQADLSLLCTMWRHHYGPAAYNTQLTRLCSLVTRAKRGGLYPLANPFHGLPRAKVPKRHPRWLTPTEAESLLHAAEDMGGYAPVIVLLGVYAGLRIGEIAQADQTWMDYQARLLTVRATMEWAPKGDKERTLPLHRRLLALEGKPDPLVPVGKRSAQATLAKLFKACGLTGATPHTLRHTFASQAVMAGVPLYTVSHWLGHASITTTQVYAHLAPQHDLMDRWG